MTKPLLRWAGGKRWLTSKIKKLIPRDLGSYYEPFCGSCAIYYSLAEILKDRPVFLSDLNGDLINFYKELQKNPKELIKILETYENTERFYYLLRGHQPNNPTESAAKFYYHNRTSFNGIYRVNLKGEYNVPYGFKKYDKLFNDETILESSKLIENASFVHQDFNWILDSITKSDFMFVDPPYTVSHNLNGFIKYNQKLFSIEDQYRLKVFLEACTKKKAKYLLTNAHHETIHTIFSVNAKEIEIDRYTSISGVKTSRKYTKEYIFTNYEVSND